MQNKQVAAAFEALADLLEFKGENVFKLRAYRNAARVIQDLTEDISVLVRENRLRDLPGIGEGIAKKIVQLVNTGKMDKLEEAKQGMPSGIFDMLAIPGVGPRTVTLAHERLGIRTLKQLAAAARNGKLASLPDMGAKKAENLLKGIELMHRAAERMPLGEVLSFVEEIVEALKSRDVKEAVPAGSLRRMRETIGDIDILTSGRNGRKIIQKFTSLPAVRRVLAAGDTKGSVVMENGVQVDLRVVPPESFGAALQYFTGAKAHNLRLRFIAKERGLKLSEYGVFKGNKRIAGRTEQEVYEALDLPLIPPPLREDRGEIEAAQQNRLPNLIKLSDIKGDLHVHTDWSDGHNTIEEMALAARELGYKYIAICDHTRALKVFGGLDAVRLRQQIAAVRKKDRKLSGISILTGTEVDIRSDGSLDLPNHVLAKVDFVTASVHSGFKQGREAITRRIIKAIENPHVNSIGHLTGRLLGRREAYELDLEAILKAAARTGTALELNAHPARLDLTDQACRRAKELSVKIAINTDAHDTEQLALMRFGVATAQRGWLERSHVLNTRTAPPKGKAAVGR